MLTDRIHESKKLASCSRDAAMAYPWIYLVADWWGRFEYWPRLIWSKCYGARQDTTLEEVAAWLIEYEQVGLLKRYGDAGQYAVWMKFRGAAPSKRAPTLIPAPPFEYEHRPPSSKKAKAAPPELILQPPTPQKAPAPRKPRAVAEPKEPAEKSWSTEACDDWQTRFGGTAPGGEIGNFLEPLVKKHGWGAVRAAWRRYLAEEDDKYVSPKRFANKYGTWARPANGTAGPSPKDPVVEAAQHWLEKHGGRDAVATVVADNSTPETESEYLARLGAPPAVHAMVNVAVYHLRKQHA